MRKTIAIALALVVWAGPASGPIAAEEPDRPVVVVTTEVLGSVVSSLVGDAADVTTLMSGGADPHSWQPSARDSQALFEADLIVANGLDLEEGLVGVLEQAAADGVPVFYATDHITVRDTDPAFAEHEEGEAGQQAESGDPHFWLDPLAMRDVVLALGQVLSQEGIDIGDRAETFADELTALDAELAASLATIPDEDRRLVSGHGALGYLADRYGLQIIGTIVPGLSSSDEPSAREVAALVEAIRSTGTTVVFTDVGTPPAVAQAIAEETGARIVELRVEQLPDGGDYADLMRALVGSISDALGTGTATG